MTHVIIIRGPLGVGKTTIARRLAKLLKALYISVDDVLEEHNLDIVEDGRIALKNFLQVNEYVLPAAREALNESRPVIFDGNFYYEKQISDIEEALHMKAHVFSLKAPLEVCVQRDKNRSLSYGKRAAAEVYGLVAELKCGISINTQEKTTDHVAQEIIELLDN